MAAKKRYRLGDLQLTILKVLWEPGPSTVADVHAATEASRSLAYTTVATMLRKMEARGLVDRREDGRKFIDSAAVAEEAISTSMADDVLERLFEGSLSDMVSHLLRTREISAGELEELERLIQESRKRS
jgi:predicted transcriptional regulator